MEDLKSDRYSLKEPLMHTQNFFWLHIRKSAGTSTQELLQPFYKVEADRRNKPKTFIQAPPDEYNDILNSWGMVLGEYQFKRVLFAKTYLYPETWPSLYSFAFSREPLDRTVSMFYYLHYRKKSIFKRVYQAAKNFKNNKKFGISTAYTFDVFLDLAEQAHFECESIFCPAGLHFSTHTAPVFGDITDMEGNVLLTKLYRVEALIPAINEVFEICGIDKKISTDQALVRNKNQKRETYHPTPLQRQKIMRLYKEDFELYENASNPQI